MVIVWQTNLSLSLSRHSPTLRWNAWNEEGDTAVNESNGWEDLEELTGPVIPDSVIVAEERKTHRRFIHARQHYLCGLDITNSLTTAQHYWRLDEWQRCCDKRVELP